MSYQAMVCYYWR